MKRFIAALSVTAALVVSALPTPSYAWAGQIAYILIGGNNQDGRACIFFYTNDIWQWHAIPKTDPMYDAEATEFFRRANRNQILTYSSGNPVPQCDNIPAAVFIGGYNP